MKKLRQCKYCGKHSYSPPFISTWSCPSCGNMCFSSDFHIDPHIELWGKCDEEENKGDIAKTLHFSKAFISCITCDCCYGKDNKFNPSFFN